MDNPTIIANLTDIAEQVRSFVELQHPGVTITSVDVAANIYYPFQFALSPVDIPVPGTIQFQVCGVERDEALHETKHVFSVVVTPETMKIVEEN